MSQGPRVSRAIATEVGKEVMSRLIAAAMQSGRPEELQAVRDLVEVGSMRRRCVDVGDLEAMAPVADDVSNLAWESDPLFRVLTRVVSNPPQPAASLGLFAPRPEPIVPDPKLVIGTAAKGLKPGFLICQIALSVPVQAMGITEPVCMGLDIFRAHEQNWGWKMLMYTGPSDFGKWFLWQWKRRYGIPDDKPASVDGFLVDGGGRVVDVRDEHQAFAACGVDYVAPWERERFLQRLANQRELMR
jgi:hypothetical protein